MSVLWEPKQPKIPAYMHLKTKKQSKVETIVCIIYLIGFLTYLFIRTLN